MHCLSIKLWKVRFQSSISILRSMIQQGFFMSITECIIFGIPKHTLSMIGCKMVTAYFWKFQSNIALWELFLICPIVPYCESTLTGAAEPSPGVVGSEIL